jgi:hypothetical protein
MDISVMDIVSRFGQIVKWLVQFFSLSGKDDSIDFTEGNEVNEAKTGYFERPVRWFGLTI